MAHPYSCLKSVYFAAVAAAVAALVAAGVPATVGTFGAIGASGFRPVGVATSVGVPAPGVKTGAAGGLANKASAGSRAVTKLDRSRPVNNALPDNTARASSLSKYHTKALTSGREKEVGFR